MKALTAREALSYGMFGDTAKLQDALDGKRSLSPANRSLAEAQLELRNAIANGVVTAYGYRDCPNQPPLMPETIPSGLFKLFKALAVNDCCETVFLPRASPVNIPRWKNITFNEKEIKNLWPKTDATLDAWMAGDVEAHPIKKRNARIDDCIMANGCPVREAKAAYGRIAPGKKLSRGQKLVGKIK
jgi:hypothetical protein